MSRRKFANPRKAVSDMIRMAYRSAPKIVLRPRPPICTSEMIATVTAPGIGDCLMLTDLPFIANENQRRVNVWSPARHFVDVMAFHPCYKVENNENPVVNPFLVDILRLNECYDLGNGHQLQRLRRAWRLPVNNLPFPVLNRTKEAIASRVILHFEPSARNVSWQRTNWHPRMRELYPENKTELEHFIKKRNDLEFIEVGKVSSEIKGARFVPTGNVKELIELIQSGTWFIGIMSGPLHIAVAYGLSCVVVVNYPKARQIVLPCLAWTGTPEEEWMYPQNMHLHQEGESPLVPRFSRESLSAAFSGDVYPFCSHEWLDLINETSRI